MGILICRSEDVQLYKDAYEEAKRIIRISDEVRISLERVSTADPGKADAAQQEQAQTLRTVKKPAQAASSVLPSSPSGWASRHLSSSRNSSPPAT
jgi:hypothetical protein